MKSVRSMIRATIRMDRATDGRSGSSRQGAAWQAANKKGLSGKSDFTISPPPAGTNSGRGDFCFRLLVRQPLFVDMDAVPGSRMRRPLQQGKDGRVNAREDYRDGSCNDDP